MGPVHHEWFQGVCEWRWLRGVIEGPIKVEDVEWFVVLGGCNRVELEQRTISCRSDLNRTVGARFDLNWTIWSCGRFNLNGAI